MPISFDASFVTSPRIRELEAYWDAKRGERDWPDRSDIHPEDIVALLPNVVITEVCIDPFSVFYRLVGTKVAEMSRFDFTGRWLSDMKPAVEEPAIWRDSYTSIVENRAPVYGRTHIPLTDGGPLMVREEFAMFPMRLPESDRFQTIAYEDYDITAVIDPEQLRPMRPRAPEGDA